TDALAARDGEMVRNLEPRAAAPRAVAAVVDIAGEGALAAVEVDRRNALARLEQRDRDMHRGGRFSRAALFVAQHDDVRRARYSACRLDQHYTSPRRTHII